MKPLNKIKVGIFFGGSSREREISFAGGRTVYDNLDKSLFQPIPIFIDSNHRMVILNWKHIYKGTIRDFYPPIEYSKNISTDFQIYVESLQSLSERDYEQLLAQVGRSIRIDDLPHLMDVAFLALHGAAGEDGQIQGLLEFLKIPYTGSGIFPSAVGIDKGLQKEWMKMAGFAMPESFSISKTNWAIDPQSYFEQADKTIGFPLVIRPAHQGSSIGVSIINNKDVDAFNKAVEHAFFQIKIKREHWNGLSKEEQHSKIQQVSDIRDGLGFPLYLEDEIIYDPETLREQIDQQLKSKEELLLRAFQSDEEVLIEAFIDGREFSCIVMKRPDGTLTALPPTEIIKGNEVYDYRSKYLPGLSRKLTPIDIADEDIYRIQEDCKKLMLTFQFDAYARIDGFIQTDGTIYLNDPNTTSGMLPSSFFFHQAAELGLNPSQFLSYIIKISLDDRKRSGVYGKNLDLLIEQLDQLNSNKVNQVDTTKKVAVIFGGYSSERHISVESGRNIYEKLSSSKKYTPIPYFLSGDSSDFKLHKLPINLVLKDNADDIRDKIENYKIHPVVEKLRKENHDLLRTWVGESQLSGPVLTSLEELKQEVDMVFIALHGRPGEDGNLQAQLEKYDIPYNGSTPDSASTTIDKYATLQQLKKHGFKVADQKVIPKSEYIDSAEDCIKSILQEFSFPFIMKPLDDGCSSAVQIIKTENQLSNYLTGIFRNGDDNQNWRDALQISHKEEFPKKDQVLIETLIQAESAKQFMEVTGGLITHYKREGLQFEMFEPSEALSSGEILSLEEKFLAGEGQNITPARFGWDEESYQVISAKVKDDLQRAAQILGVSGYARIDAFVRIFDLNRIETIIIEINSLPGMTPATCIFHQCAINGYKPFDFIDGILTFAEERQTKNLAQT